MGIFSAPNGSQARASETRARIAEDNARKLKKDADHALDQANTLSSGSAGLALAAAAVAHQRDAITKRSRDLLFQMAVKDLKFQSTINRMLKAFPNEKDKIKNIVNEVDTEYNNDHEYLRKVRESTDSQDLFPPENKQAPKR